jgi:hypothetical protein
MGSPLILDDTPFPKIKKRIDAVSQEVDLEKIEEKTKTRVPNDYIEVRLKSLGRLDAPKVLHFRDYTMADALELNVYDDEDRLKALISVLNNMVFEEFDCAKLHPKELMQIVYEINKVFISSKMDKPYYIDDQLPEGTEQGQLRHSSNIAMVEINILKLLLQNIDEDSKGKPRDIKFKEPFTIIDKVKQTRAQFRLSRIGDLVFAQEYCNEVFADELSKFKNLKRAVKKIKDDCKTEKEYEDRLNQLIDSDLDTYEEYAEFQNKQGKVFVTIMNAQQIISIDGVVLNTIEEKLNAYRNNISQTMWDSHTSVIEEYNFGILENYTFFSDVLKKNITRRFLLELVDFLPNPEKNYRTRYSVEFS